MQPMLLLLRSRCCKRLLYVLFLSLITLYAHAYAGAQNEHPVTLSGNGITLRSVFKAIKQQTGYAVMYSTAATALNQDEKVSVNFKDTPLDDVLSFLLRGKELDWKYSDDVLVIHKKEKAAPEKKMAVDSTVTPAMLSGKITDANGVPLPGVTVIVKGTTQGTTTDPNGQFTLPRVAAGDVLVLSSIGFEKREIAVKGKSILAQMSLQVNQLDETVAIAYGTTTQRLSTGNISSVKAKDIEKQPVTNPLLALQGRVPGLFITQSTGVPNGGVQVRIQGQNSIEKGNDPFYVVDGVPYPAQLLSSLLGGSIMGSSGGDRYSNSNPLSFINPSDIESIDVLKDADATAIYGSRAANGAILITTKKGKAGQMKVDLNLQQGWGQVTRKLKMLNTSQYLQMRHEAKANDGADILPNDYDINGTWDTTRYTDWQKTLIGGTAKYTNANASISGGSAVMQYLVGATYHRETTVFPGDFADQKANLHFTLNSISPNQKFRFQLTGNYMLDDNRLPQTDFTTAAITLEPLAPALYKVDGSLNWQPNTAGNSTWTNPMAASYIQYTNKTYNLISNLMLSYDILPGLQLKSSLGYTNIRTDDFYGIPSIAQKPEARRLSSLSANYGNMSMNSWIVEPQANYTKKIDKGNLDVLLGATIQQNNNSTRSLVGIGYNSDKVLEDIFSATTVRVNNTALAQYKYAALFGRLNYNWLDKYIINLTARRDGSSRFGSQNQFHTFGSIGAAWIFSQESFIQNSLHFLSFGKLRGSYGNTGNDQVGDYSFINLYNIVYTQVPYQNNNGLAPGGLPNPHLQWEETRKLQLGVDLGLMQDRILLNVTYARNRSSNQLLVYNLPSITGYSTIITNFPATLQNKSWEFTLNTTNIKTPVLQWSTNINLTIPQNKLLSFPNIKNTSYANILIIGQPVNILQSFHALGVDPATGLYQTADSHGNPTAAPDYFKDRTALINLSPRFYGGLQNSIEYKGFQLDFLFQFVKQKGTPVLYNNGTIVGPGVFTVGSSNQPITVLDRWKKPGDNAIVQKFSTNFFASFIQLNQLRATDAVVADASYIRLKNISLSWQLPAKWRQKMHVQNCRIYTQGQNLLTITNYKGLDPENQGAASLPPLRVWTLGLQIGW